MIDTGDPTVDALVVGLLHERTEVEKTDLTYTFDLSAALDNDPEYSRFNQAMIDRHLAVFTSVSSFTGATFTEAEPGADADLFFAFRLDTPTAYVVNYLDGILHVHDPSRDQPDLGSYVDHLVLHEFGHGLGLEHGHDPDGLPPEFQGHDWTVMSYRANPDAATLFYTDSHGPETFMLADVAALQYLYGANFDFQAGNTLYTVDFSTGEFFVDGVGQGVPINNETLRTVWDGAGNDTLDLSNARAGLEIDLRPGAFTSFGDAYLAFQGEDAEENALFSQGNLANPYLYQGNTSSLLENAIGGRFDDVITGNVANNRLEGRGGDDSIYGLAGDDTLYGFEGDDELSGGEGDDLILDGLGQTTASGDEGDDFVIALSGDALLTGGADNDILVGGADNDLLRGEAGNDVLRGDAGRGLLFGDDLLDGGEGDDLLMGGRGEDQFIFRPGEGADVIGSFVAGDLAPGAIADVVATGADFRSGVDQIVLSGFVDVTAENVLSFLSEDMESGHAVFAAEDTSITFFGVTSDQILAEDFVFL